MQGKKGEGQSRAQKLGHLPWLTAKRPLSYPAIIGLRQEKCCTLAVAGQIPSSSAIRLKICTHFLLTRQIVKDPTFFQALSGVSLVSLGEEVVWWGKGWWGGNSLLGKAPEGTRCLVGHASVFSTSNFLMPRRPYGSPGARLRPQGGPEEKY